jgi:hypothetical protein
MRRLLVVGASCLVIPLVGWELGLQAVLDPLLMPSEYIRVCKTAGVRILARPRAPVTSVALDYVPLPVREPKTRYEFSIGGTLQNVQYGAPRLDKHLVFFDHRHWSGTDPSQPHFTRFQRGQPPANVRESSADVRVVDTVENAEEFQKPLLEQRMITHRLRVTDQRNGDVLAEMVYVVDVKRRRGCGLNARNAIDVSVLIMEATRP